jgi:hypothetical protein
MSTMFKRRNKGVIMAMNKLYKKRTALYFAIESIAKNCHSCPLWNTYHESSCIDTCVELLTSHFKNKVRKYKMNKENKNDNK